MTYKTTKDKVKFSGVGLHTGTKAEIVIEPSFDIPPQIKFFLNTCKIVAEVKNVVDTYRCTVLGINGERIYTTEHLLSALYGLGITNINIFVYGCEIPSFDGSAKMFVEKFLDVGLQEISCDEKMLPKTVVVDKEIEFSLNHAKYKVYPNKNLEISCTINYPNTPIGTQKIQLVITPEIYTKEIANAKTFCFLKDVEEIWSKGLGRGGSLENVIVVDENKILNPEKMSYQDEFVRHKLLDFIGDLSLLARDIRAKIETFSPSHFSNIEFVKYLTKNFVF